jgi:hypothetical protein
MGLSGRGGSRGIQETTKEKIFPITFPRRKKGSGELI